MPGMVAFPQAVEQARPGPETGRRDALPRRCLLGCLLLAAVLVTGCALAPKKSYDDLGNSAPAALAPLFGFLESAAADEAGLVEDPRTGASVWVIAYRAYPAASGRLCWRFSVMSPEGYEGMAEGLACRDERGDWTMSELLINPDDLGASRRWYH